MFLYKTVLAYAEAEQVIERSRFIARVMPVESYEEAQAFVAACKAEYKEATHNVPVIVCGNKQEMQWASEDGEPQGTAGAPMLRLVVEEGMTNLALVVTRYFGGTKLGTGGLMRAYSGVAKAGIAAAGICSVRESLQLQYRIDYHYLAKIQNAAEGGLFAIDGTEYTDKVTLTVSADRDDGDAVRHLFREWTAGQEELLSEKIGKIKICN